MNRKMLGICLVAISLMVMVASTYGLISSLTIHEAGTISMVKAYWDAACTQPVVDIDWGAVLPDSSQTRTIYLKNFGETMVNITLEITNWSPGNAGNYMKASWDREAEAIPSGIALQTVVELTVFPNITETSINVFSFDRVIHEAW